MGVEKRKPMRGDRNLTSHIRNWRQYLWRLESMKYIQENHWRMDSPAPPATRKTRIYPNTPLWYPPTFWKSVILVIFCDKGNQITDVSIPSGHKVYPKKNKHFESNTKIRSYRCTMMMITTLFTTTAYEENDDKKHTHIWRGGGSL